MCGSATISPSTHNEPSRISTSSSGRPTILLMSSLFVSGGRTTTMSKRDGLLLRYCPGLAIAMSPSEYVGDMLIPVTVTRKPSARSVIRRHSRFSNPKVVPLDSP